MRFKQLIATLFLCWMFFAAHADVNDGVSPRSRLSMDKGWKFALGHPFDAKKDFNSAVGYFSYLAKAGYGDGAAKPDFDDRGWRSVDLPHDWCAELPFTKDGGHSHGYKAIGRSFPENSVGWYRKAFTIPESDLGKRISIEFDGVYRCSQVWVNGFYLGTHLSGYDSFSYDITEYLNYGGENVVVVRADATMEEGWYYEGAGIYRHVWLTKTSPLHIPQYGTFVTTTLSGSTAAVTARTTVRNLLGSAATFDIREEILNSRGEVVATATKSGLAVAAGAERELYSSIAIDKPQLWSVDTPTLYCHRVAIVSSGRVVDTYVTRFGIRTVRFDPNEGFFLNGKHLKIVGVNQHQDHAGVGTAIPDALQEWRIKQLKEMGCNGIRTSHNPPTPELLDVCDRLGMLVLNENRLMGINKEHFESLERLMKRDRNHPSVILWSVGNEEWAIEGNIKGARIGEAMLRFAQRLDSSRSFTAAVSGGWDNGTGMVMPVMGYNYIVQGDIDGHHAKFPWQAGIGTEESNTIGTRGVYSDDRANGRMAATNRMPENVGTESGWQFYAARPFLAGLFFWTGFDYRGEPNPLAWPAVSSQYGVLDLCGFPKDIAFYLKSWWGGSPVVHLAKHWCWAGLEGKVIDVPVYSNANEVELFLNGKSLGRKAMPQNGHLQWNIPYKAGTLLARGYDGTGRIVASCLQKTAGEASQVALSADRYSISANGDDVAVVTVSALDSKGVLVPFASNDVVFEVAGPAKIIGVGNGDPSSHEPDQQVDSVVEIAISSFREKAVDSTTDRVEVAGDYNDSDWKPAFEKPKKWNEYTDSLVVIRGSFTMGDLPSNAAVTLFGRSIVQGQSVYINGHLAAKVLADGGMNPAVVLNHGILKKGINTFAVVGKRFRLKHEWDEPNTDPGKIQVVVPAKTWSRKLFSGYAQVLVQASSQPGTITLTATSGNLKGAKLTIEAKPSLAK